MKANGEFRSVNPATEVVLTTFEHATDSDVAAALTGAADAFTTWSTMKLESRCAYLGAAASYLREHRARLAALATAEMGKPIAEAEAEIDKCAWGFEYF